MISERVPWRCRRSVVEEDLQASRSDCLRYQALFGVLQYELYLFARNTRKPFQELTNTRAAFEIFKQGADGDSGMLEKPFAATLAGCALDRSAFRPIKHALNSRAADGPRQAWDALPAAVTRLITDFR